MVCWRWRQLELRYGECTSRQPNEQRLVYVCALNEEGLFSDNMRQMATLARCVWYQAFEERPVSVRGRWVEVLDSDINMKD